VVALGVQRVGGDHDAGEAQAGQQRLEGGPSPGAPSIWRVLDSTRHRPVEARCPRCPQCHP
jgi:hypothetical protein